MFRAFRMAFPTRIDTEWTGLFCAGWPVTFDAPRRRQSVTGKLLRRSYSHRCQRTARPGLFFFGCTLHNAPAVASRKPVAQSAGRGARESEVAQTKKWSSQDYDSRNSNSAAQLICVPHSSSALNQSSWSEPVGHRLRQPKFVCAEADFRFID